MIWESKLPLKSLLSDCSTVTVMISYTHTHTPSPSIDVTWLLAPPFSSPPHFFINLFKELKGCVCGGDVCCYPPACVHTEGRSIYIYIQIELIVITFSPPPTSFSPFVVPYVFFLVYREWKVYTIHLDLLILFLYLFYIYTYRHKSESGSNLRTRASGFVYLLFGPRR